MRIGMLAPIAWRTPPRHYGPWERVASLLTEGLVARGHEVTLFATADSATTARLDAVSPHGYEEDDSLDGRVWEAMHVARAIERSGEFDLVHSHLDWLPLAFGSLWRAPLVTTVHGFSGPRILPAYESARSYYVAISDADRAPSLSYVATVQHGIDFAEFDLVEHGGDDLAILGRIHPHKGTAHAIEIARRAGRVLHIAGIVQDEQYFSHYVVPFIDGDRVRYHGAVEPAERSRLLGSVAALLHPIDFDEPFGLSVVEAMACGTPVVAYRRGSMPDVIDDGVTGFAVIGIEEAVTAVAAAADLDRGAVHARARDRFGVDRMVDEYVAVYERILARGSRGAWV